MLVLKKPIIVPTSAGSASPPRYLFLLPPLRDLAIDPLPLLGRTCTYRRLSLTQALRRYRASGAFENWWMPVRLRDEGIVIGVRAA